MNIHFRTCHEGSFLYPSDLGEMNILHQEIVSFLLSGYYFHQDYYFNYMVSNITNKYMRLHDSNLRNEIIVRLT